jgi:hypothetical protein
MNTRFHKRLPTQDWSKDIAFLRQVHLNLKESGCSSSVKRLVIIGNGYCFHSKAQCSIFHYARVRPCSDATTGTAAFVSGAYAIQSQ